MFLFDTVPRVLTIRESLTARWSLVSLDWIHYIQISYFLFGQKPTTLKFQSAGNMLCQLICN